MTTSANAVTDDAQHPRTAVAERPAAHAAELRNGFFAVGDLDAIAWADRTERLLFKAHCRDSYKLDCVMYVTNRRLMVVRYGTLGWRMLFLGITKVLSALELEVIALPIEGLHMLWERLPFVEHGIFRRISSVDDAALFAGTAKVKYLLNVPHDGLKQNNVKRVTVGGPWLFVKPSVIVSKGLLFKKRYTLRNAAQFRQFVAALDAIPVPPTPPVKVVRKRPNFLSGGRIIFRTER